MSVTSGQNDSFSSIIISKWEIIMLSYFNHIHVKVKKSNKIIINLIGPEIGDITHLIYCVGLFVT